MPATALEAMGLVPLDNRLEYSLEGLGGANALSDRLPLAVEGAAGAVVVWMRGEFSTVIGAVGLPMSWGWSPPLAESRVGSWEKGVRWWMPGEALGREVKARDLSLSAKEGPSWKGLGLWYRLRMIGSMVEELMSALELVDLPRAAVAE